MFTRSTSGNQNTAVGNGRRAFRDVTNASRSNANGKAVPVPAKRNNGVKTRSMSIGGTETRTVEVPRPTSAFSRSVTLEDENVGVTNYTHFQPNVRPAPDSYQLTGNVDNVDERDQDDPFCVTAYVQDMYQHFRLKEIPTSVRPAYMENQPQINERMRSILVDWLIEVHLKFKLVPETLYLTINLIDRYLEREEVSRPRLQLVGVTSLLIASKYEEIYPPELRDLVYICDRAYTRQDILDMETEILKTLEYNITIPSAHVFLVRYLKAGHADKKIVQLSCYVLDATLLTYSLLHYLPSQLAAASVFIARRAVGRNGWSPTLLQYSEYCEEAIMPVARAVIAAQNSLSPELKAVTKKYSSHRYGGVASTELADDF